MDKGIGSMQNNNSQAVKVWDPVVRIFHWGVVSAFFIAFLSSEDNFADLHVVAGYVILGLVAVRLVWGLIGSRHARFSSFVKSPAEVITYFKQMLAMDAPSHEGHNPAAGYMILALLGGLILTGVTGMVAYGAEENAGPLAGMMGGLGLFGFDLFEELHQFFAFATLGLAGFHVVGVLFSSMLHNENLIRAMITGVKVMHVEATVPAASVPAFSAHTASRPNFTRQPGFDEAAHMDLSNLPGSGRRNGRSVLSRVALWVLVPALAILLGGAVVSAALDTTAGNGDKIAHSHGHDDD